MTIVPVLSSRENPSTEILPARRTPLESGRQKENGHHLSLKQVSRQWLWQTWSWAVARLCSGPQGGEVAMETVALSRYLDHNGSAQLAQLLQCPQWSHKHLHQCNPSGSATCSGFCFMHYKDGTCYVKSHHQKNKNVNMMGKSKECGLTF